MGISSAGIGSGLDVNGLISQLMQVERQPLDALNAKQQTFNAQLSAFGQVKSALDAFKTAASNLELDSAFAATTATSSNTSYLTATTDNLSAVAGSYDVTVSSLAQAGISASNLTVSDPSAPIGGGTGTLTFSASGKSFSINIDGSVDSLQSISDKINNAMVSGETTSQGLATASVINDGSNYRLVVASTQQGLANNVTISGTSASYLNFTTTQSANDASFSINGLSMTRSTNTVSDAISGVTLNLVGADPAGTTSANAKHTTLTVARDTATVSQTVNNFISAYNKLSSTINSLHQKGGTLEADNSATSVISQLQAVFNQPASIAGNTNSWLAQIGISFQKDGTLALDSATFSKALNTDFKGTVSLFTDSNSGFANRLYTAASNMLDTNGLLDSRISGLNTQINSLNDDIDQENVRLANVQTRLQTQYANLDALLGTMQQTSSYLSSQLR